MAINHNCFIEFDSIRSLQSQVREYLVSAILNGIFPGDQALPSCRKLSNQLGVSRNTVSLVYESLLEDGYLISKPRSGYYLSKSYQNAEESLQMAVDQSDSAALSHAPNWSRKLKIESDKYPRIVKPSLWSRYQYPFIFGQPSIEDFPLTQWREATRKVIADPLDHSWLCDKVDKDVELLVEQIRTRVLPQRGIHAQSDEILITLGSQNALYLISTLLMNHQSRVGVENPGYREAINIFALSGAQLHPHQVDSQGLHLNEHSPLCDYFYTTPSHQAPTGVTMSCERRKELLEMAAINDAIIIEDDYDAECNVETNPMPALKASDKNHRVIYISSFSKLLAPGLRLGYIVAPEELIYELRNLRRLMYRHTPSRIQMEMAHFISQGYYDSFVRKFRENTRQRWELANRAAQTYLPHCQRLAQNEMANSLWLQTPAHINSQRLASRASQASILIETGYSHFLSPQFLSPQRHSSDASEQQCDPDTFFRLGFHALDKQLIEPGIKKLAQVMDS